MSNGTQTSTTSQPPVLSLELTATFVATATQILNGQASTIIFSTERAFFPLQPGSSSSETETLSPSPSTPTVTNSGDGSAATSVSASGDPALATTSSVDAPSPENQGNSGITGGAAAGIAVGCALFGALIAAAVILVVMKKRVSQTRRSGGGGQGWFPGGSSKIARERNPRTQPSNAAGKGKGPAYIEKPIDELGIESVLEQPRDDESIGSAVKALFKSIDDHVDNFYAQGHIRDVGTSKSQPVPHAVLPKGIQSQTNVDMGGLLADKDTRASAIISLITAKALDAIDFSALPEHSLLPEVVARFLSTSSALFQGTQRARLHVSRWRTSTAFLLGPPDANQASVATQEVMRRLMADLETHLCPFVRPETRKDRDDHMVGLFKRAQRLGLLLLSQPAEWEFNWKPAMRDRRSGSVTQPREADKVLLVVQPQVLRLTDNLARTLDRPLTVLRALVLD